MTQLEQIKALLLKGWDVGEIAFYMNCSCKTVEVVKRSL